MATGTLNFSVTRGMSNNTWEVFDMGTLSYPNNGTYSRHMPDCNASWKPDWQLSWGDENEFTQYKWGNWDNAEHHIKNSSYPGEAILKVKNMTGSFNNITVTLAVEYTYNDSYSVTVNAETGGSATPSVNSASSGATVTITCSPNTGYSANVPTASGITFTSAGTNKWSFTMPSSNVTVSCTFSKVNYTVTTAVSPSGSGTLTSNKSTANYGDTVTLTPSASTGYQFSSWTKTPNNLSINSSNQFTMPAQNVSVTANFVKTNYSVTVASNPAAGGTLTTNKATANYGDTVTLTATAASGYHFSSWTKSPTNLSINGSNQFTMPAQNVSVTANWSRTYTAVTAGEKIMATDRSQTGTSTTAGNVMSDSHFTSGTKIEASTFNSQVLGL